MKKAIFFTMFLLAFLACSSESNDTVPTTNLYFPPNDNSVWETKPMSEFGWNQNAVDPLLTYLEEKNTKGFIILIDGKIVMEHYFNGHSATTNWYWASAGKTLTSAIVGIAEQENFLKLNDKVSDYIGTGWTSEPSAKENLISIRHLLTMTAGFDDSLHNDCVMPDCLVYKADAGMRWAYHNSYVKLQDVVANATSRTFNNYFNTRLRDKIGMNGSWIQHGNNSVYMSDTRSMARFGLLMLNKGKWKNEMILNQNYFEDATNTSQSINESYGYLWWLNGKSTYRLPQTQYEFSGSLVSEAPNDMFMGLGKNDQKIYVIPSKKMVVVRMGNAADGENFALSDFDNSLWEKVNALTN